MDYNINIRKKDNGLQAIVQYKTEGCKWKQKSKQGFENSRMGKRSAQAWAEDIVKNLREEITYNAADEFGSITFKEFCDMHLKHLALHVEHNTIENYRYSISTFTSIHDIAMTSITTIHIQNCVDDMIRKGLANYTVKKNVDRIKALFNAAVDKYNILKASPVKGITIKGSKAPAEKNALTVKELHKLIALIEIPDYKMIAILGSFCGFRIGEIMGLTWDDIDFENNTININKQWKKNKLGEYAFGELKTKNSYRVNPMPAFVRKELLAYKAENKVMNINGRLFNRDTRNVTSNLLKYFKKKGYTTTLHELRHSFCTNLIANGLDFKTTALLMGDTVEEIMKTYSHVTMDMKEQAINIMNTF